MTAPPRRDLLGIESLDRATLLGLLEQATSMSKVLAGPSKRLELLRGKTVLNCFLESSTRTRTSFELAGKRLSADVVNLGASGSSTEKGEGLLDTARTLDAMGAEVIVLRHPSSGAAELVARHVRASVVNAGDGMHEHPTQALLDCATIRRRKGAIEGLTVAILGDVAHSRVARSNALALTRLGASVRFAGPRTLLPSHAETLGARLFDRVEPAVEGADVVMVLRLQQERMARGLVPSLAEYARRFGLTPERLALARPGALVMHPGPMNRGVEISPEVADGPQSVILEQVAQGVAVRMAVLAWACGASAL